MEKLTSSFNTVTSLMDQNIRGVQIGCYSVALVSLSVALRKVRPFSKFRRPSDIPNHFVQEKRELSGVVDRIEPSGSILMIDHKPLIRLPIVAKGQLPVKISGVRVSGLGLNWLQAIVAGSEVKFIPVSKEKDFVQCQVLLLQTITDKKQQLKVNVINVGENLLKIGFGTTEEVMRPLSEDPAYLIYYKLLQNAENYALRKKLGVKYYLKPTKKVLSKMYEELSILLGITRKLKKVSPKVPKLLSS